MKRIGLFFLVFILAFLILPMRDQAYAVTDVWDGSIASSFDGGNGTQSNPYKISSASQLAYLAEIVNNGDWHSDQIYYKLTSDIDLNGLEWIPIGSNDSYDHHFSDVFDGTGHIITGLRINTVDSYQGLFGEVSGGKIKNVNIKDSYVRGGERVGGLVGSISSGLIDNCSVSGTVIGTGYLGGICGTSGSAISNCTNHAKVVGTDWYVGGIVGRGSTTYRCVNLGTISSSANYIGGIAGYVSFDAITDCFNYGSVGSASSRNVGGIAGTATTINNCGNAGEVKASDNAGGIVGDMTQGSIKCVWNGGMINCAAGYAGGIGGWIQNSSIENTYYQTDRGASTACGYSYSNTTSETYSSANLATDYFVSLFNELLDPDLYTLWTRNDDLYSGFPYIELRTVKGLSITTQPATTTYYPGMQFDPAGMVVTAMFTDGSSAPVKGYTVAPSEGLTKGTRSVEIQYNGFTASVNISVVDLPFSGSGTKKDPYIIKTEKDLRTVAQLCKSTGTSDAFLAAYYRQTANITIKESGWIPIGPDPDHEFSGEYNGQNYKIIGLKNSSESVCMGLFGCVSGSITFVNLQDVNFSGSKEIGGIAGELTGSLIGCRVDNINISGSTSFAGGIVGTMKGGSLMDCRTLSGAISAKYAGGIVSVMRESSIMVQCENHAEINSNEATAGGISGSTYSSSIQDSSNYGTVTATMLAGGVSANLKESVILDCNNYESVTTTDTSGNAGGIAASFTGGTVKRCNNLGSITANLYAAGIVGYASSDSESGMDLTIDTCFNDGIISSLYSTKSMAGGIVANQKNCTISNCLNNGWAVSRGDVGGITAQSVDGAVIYNCANTADMTTWSTSNYVGGITGYAGKVVIEACYSTGPIKGSTSYAGGIAGYFGSYNSVITNCYYSEDSASKAYSGGSGGQATALSLESMKTDSFSSMMDSASTLSDCNKWLRNSITNETLPVPGEWFLQKLIGITVTKLPDRSKYYPGDTFDPKGLVVKGVLTNGSKIEVSDDYNLAVDPLTSPGLKEVTVSLDGFETTFNIVVYGLSLPVIENGKIATVGYAYESAPEEAIYILAAYDYDGRFLGVDIEEIKADADYHELKIECSEIIGSASLYITDNSFTPVKNSIDVD